MAQHLRKAWSNQDGEILVCVFSLNVNQSPDGVPVPQPAPPTVRCVRRLADVKPVVSKRTSWKGTAPPTAATDTTPT